MIARRTQSGFSLLEVVIAISLAAIFGVVVLSNFGEWSRFYMRLETTKKLRDLQQSFAATYRANALLIDNAAGAVITLPAVSINNDTTANDDTFTDIERFATQARAILSRDGYNNRFRVFVSNRLSQVVANTTINYHMVALVSPGLNSQIDLGTAFDPVTGTLTLAGDDRGVLVDGYAIQRENYDLTMARMNKVADAYATYFRMRYLSDPNRDVAVNFFANVDTTGTVSARYDQNGVIGNSLGAPAVATALNLPGALSLSLQDLTDAYGQVFRVDNSSAVVRNPDNATAGMSTPPYSAAITTTLPGNVVFSVAVNGNY